MSRNRNDLGEQLFAFAVISDTHVNPDEDICNSPFPVNARANRRFRHVIADLNRRDIDFVVHLGDLLHPVPETGDLYAAAANTYRAIEADLRVPITHVPGNHDIGDTAVKGAPASPSTEATIEAWTKEFGAQYQAFSHGDVRFILLNAQLINSGLPDEARQAQWFEAELAATDTRVMVMLHHPLYLCFPEEPDHYDNTDQPGRDWILGLIERHGVEAMFAGHAHNFWYDRIGETDYYLAPSTCFVRQDYSEMLRVTPPDGSEFGRDDKAKLGYFIVSVFEKGHTVRFVRTYGTEQAAGDNTAPLRNLAPTPAENAAPLIGFDLRQNWAEISEVPPSGGLDEFDRKHVRNDYPLLALIEMGVRDIRIPLADLRDPMRRQRLCALNHLGFRPTIFGFGIPSDADLALIGSNREYLRDWEMTIDWASLNELQSDFSKLQDLAGLPIYLSRMRSKKDLPAGALYFHVINHGFTQTDTQQLDELAAMNLPGVSGAVFRLGSQMPVVETISGVDMMMSERGLRASIHMRVSGDNPAEPHRDHTETCARFKAALEIGPSLKTTRLFCDTLVDNDRGYFPRMGAIDRAGNPNRLFEVIRAAHLIT
ncbi:metallophosphoesterase family protein [Phaeobacter sp. C3_T13_0]|uniref:metallophosphoesterase family protein n=1 Tax=Phaeobacter cretensis TaxID=3342641 RepID=UPI0039BC5917